ncbi:MAG: hypothetical protein J6P03_06280 [Opitutales bacterium]|nr:hypothetical protein [Opitutales bacterium]
MAQPKQKQKDGFFANLVLNIVLPALILTKGEKLLVKIGLAAEGQIPPIALFLAALAFPIFYGAADLIKRGKWNIFSIFGLLNVLLTGTIGLFELSREWIIAKEAGIPALLGVCVCVSALTKKPLAKVLFFTPAIFDVEKISKILAEKKRSEALERTFKISTLLISLSFFASAAIQFFLARSIFTEGASAAEFNAQVGQMTWVSYIAVFAPCIAIMFAAMFKTFADIKKFTGLGFEETLAESARQK